MTRYTFSGHESFQCKSLWLKKGYDFMCLNKDFNAPDAVVELGVGKNMVASIRYWLKAFGLRSDNKALPLAEYIFNEETGVDPFIEDLGTLWILHYNLVSSGVASIYKLFFLDFHKERKDFTREQLQSFIKRKSSETSYFNLYNENTVKKDISVLLQNYVLPSVGRPNEDFFVLLIDLNLIRSVDAKSYTFNVAGKRTVIPEVFLYAIIDYKGVDNTVSFYDLLDLALIFCLTSNELLETINSIVAMYPESLVFTDDGGIKQLSFVKDFDKFEILEKYYKKQA